MTLQRMVSIPALILGLVAFLVLILPATSRAETVVVTGTYVNLRSGPGTGYVKVGQVSRGAVLTVVGKSGSWYRVRLKSGREAWIAGWLVKPVSAAPTLSQVSNREEPQTETLPQGGQQPSSPATVGVFSPPQADSTAAAPAVAHPPEVSRGETDGPLVAYELRENGGVTEVTLTFVRPVAAQVSFLPDPPRLVVDVTGLPPGELPQSQDFTSGLVSRIRAAWHQPEVARIVLDLVGGGQPGWEAISSGDNRLLKLRVAPGPLYAVTGKVIVLDPGHGGSDPGAIGPTGLKEKDFNLAVARLAAAELSRRGAKVYLTRTDDTDVDLYSRAALANARGAQIFVSIHANAWGNPYEVERVSGTSTWYAPVNDAASPKAKSELLARCLQKSLVAQLVRKDLGLYTANFAVLRYSEMPAALVEVAFISNPEEERLMYTEWFQEAAARGIVEGLESFFGQFCKD